MVKDRTVLTMDFIETPWKKQDYDGPLADCPWCGAHGRVSSRGIMYLNGYVVTEIKVGCPNIYCAIKPFAMEKIVSITQNYRDLRDMAIRNWNGLKRVEL